MKISHDGKLASYGAAFYLIGAAQFLAGMTITALYYGPPAYSPFSDSISDLQAVHCGLFQGNEVCSPLHLLANFSVAVLGLFVIVGSVLIRTRFPPGRRRTVAVGLLIAAGIGSVANAFTPEDVVYAGDIVTALVAFLGANFGLIQIGRLMSSDKRWGNFQVFTEALGVVGLMALIFDGLGITGPLGTGGIEWLIVAPILLWALVFGFRFISKGKSPPTHEAAVVPKSRRVC